MFLLIVFTQLVVVVEQLNNDINDIRIRHQYSYSKITYDTARRAIVVFFFVMILEVIIIVKVLLTVLTVVMFWTIDVMLSQTLRSRKVSIALVAEMVVA